MKISSTLKTRVLAREWVIGTWANLGSAVSAEIAGLAGFDWVVLDHEHGPGGEDTLLHQLQAVGGTPAFPIVRIAANEPPRFKRVLDVGAGGVMVPYVSSEAEARAAVAAMRYPPRGIRGVAKCTRTANFGQEFEDYYAHAHERLVTVVQIETPEALANIDAIAAVDGVDVLFVGPLDLSTNLGVQAQYAHQRFVEARQKVAAAAKHAGKAAGILLNAAAQAAEVRAEGYTFVGLGSDGGAVNTVLRQCAAALRSPSQQPKA